MHKGRPIYVEILIQAQMETLWEYTQTPELHQQWDLRFSEITYIPITTDAEPQRFLYKTNIGFGLSIAGEGETVGTKEKGGVLTSSLKFSSSNSLSLISEGAGYWRYVPTDQGVRFLTRYDYRTRFGWLGSWLDRLIFRPLMGWATAWSFDCLRLWVERGISPGTALRRFIMELVMSVSLFVVWVYQGLVPKLLVPDSGEVDMVQGISLFKGHETMILSIMGLGEIGFGLLFVLLRGKRRKALHKWNIVLLILLGLSAIGHPVVYAEPFNPIGLNLAMIALSVVSLLNASDLPYAGSCLRRPIGGGGEA